jgi:tetratricopeptide (TPR) repeat protein
MSDLPNPKSFLDHARFLGKTGRYTQAEVLIKHCLSINPEYAHAYSILALVYVNTKRTKLSIELAEKAVALSPSTSWFYYILADIYGKNQLWKKAEQTIATAIQLNPRKPNYFAYQAHTYNRRKQYREAIESAEHGLSIDPKDAFCLRTKIISLLKLRSFLEVTEIVNLLLSLYPNDSESYALLGSLYLAQNKVSQAAVAHQESLRLNPLQRDLYRLVKSYPSRCFANRKISKRFT